MELNRPQSVRCLVISVFNGMRRVLDSNRMIFLEELHGRSVDVASVPVRICVLFVRFIIIV